MTPYLVTVRSRREPDAPQHLFLLAGELDREAVGQLAADLLHDPVVQSVTWQTLDELEHEIPPPPPGTLHVEVAYKPGVTDNEAESVRIGAERLGIRGLRTVKTLRRYCVPQSAGAAGLYNPLIQTVLVAGAENIADRRAFYDVLLRSAAPSPARVERVALIEADDEELLRISRQGVLALDLDEMRAIQQYFRHEEREPSDGELETIAQTWSEHCSHKTFKGRVRYKNRELRTLEPRTAEPRTAEPRTAEPRTAEPRTAEPRTAEPSTLEPRTAEPNPTEAGSESSQLDAGLYAALRGLDADCEIDSLIKTYLMAATKQVLAMRASQPSTPGSASSASGSDAPGSGFSVLSAFVDNAGIIAFTDDYEVSFKVETHNHPSALEPFGGANTGVGGVVRDVLGVSALPIANTDVLCFGPLDLPDQEGEAGLPPGVLHPRQIAVGVVAGVRDYGNKLGIPTVNGAVLYDPGYIANPLVYCGTVGLAPRGRHPRSVRPGDAIVVLGGRTGRDGIHGATFSSVELTSTTAEEVGSAVQIGDPITEKKLIDVILQARDAGLYSAITDCGAGGLSSAVGEMGAECGADVELADVPLKYAGLQPWEIWLSEAQERMVLAVPQDRLAALLELCASEDVEATVIGRFTDTGRLHVAYRGETVVDLDMGFLHDGRPQRVLEAVWTPPAPAVSKRPAGSPSLPDTLLALLAHPNIASKAPIIRTYDHEVGGRTVVKPLVGAMCDGPADAAVLQPLHSTTRGIVIACGINPRYGQLDPYWMALACVDEALRNVVAVGGDPGQAAILDNFCWGDPRQPDRMAGLVRAAAGCYDAALAYRAPFISGKDSLNNEYRDAQGRRTPIPPTLLISALAIIPDVRAAVTLDLKEPGNYLYLVGLTRAELGGAHVLDVGGLPHPEAERAVPRVDLATAPRLMAALHAAIGRGLVRACHDLSEGGLAVAAAEMAIAGRLGLDLELARVPRDEGVVSDALALFAESTSRFLCEVRPEDAPAFEEALAGLPHARVGGVVAEQRLVAYGLDGAEVLRADVARLTEAWQGTKVV